MHYVAFKIIILLNYQSFINLEFMKNDLNDFTSIPNIIKFNEFNRISPTIFYCDVDKESLSFHISIISFISIRLAVFNNQNVP